MVIYTYTDTTIICPILCTQILIEINLRGGLVKNFYKGVLVKSTPHSSYSEGWPLRWLSKSLISITSFIANTAVQ